MKCLMKYQWVKLPRNRLPEGKGLMGYWAKLASRAAFRKGQASYCGYSNAVSPGMWSGGVVGLKRILGVNGLPRSSINLRNRTRGLTSGATRYLMSQTMCFHFWRQQSSMENMAPF